MNHLLLDGILLAQQSPLDNFAREFQGRQARLNPGYVITGLLVMLGLAATVWLLSRVLERRDGRQPVDSPLMLFLALAKAHSLRWPETWLLWRVARDQQLQDPARLFLEPERMAPAQLSPMLRLQAAELESLCRRLFAGIPEPGMQARQPAPSRAKGPSGDQEAGGRAASAFPADASRASAASGWPPPASTSGSLPPATSE